jgi:MFS family permease
VAFLVLPDVDADVEATSSLLAVPALVAGDVRIFTVGFINFAVRFLVAGVLLSTVVLYARENDITLSVLSSTGVSGVVMAVAVVFASVTTIAVGRVSDGLSNRALLTIPALTVFAAGFVTLGLVPTAAGTALGVALVGVGGTNPPLLAYLGDISPADDGGPRGGVDNVFGDLGSTLGPLVALPVAARVSIRTEYLGCVVVVALAAVLVGSTLFGANAPDADEYRTV